MKNTIQTINQKFAAITASVLTVLLFVTANTASTGLSHEPEQPKSIDRFKMVK